MAKSRDIELQGGRRANDGTVKLSAYPPELLQLSVSYRGERSASVLLTRQQIQLLRQALTEFENEMPPPSETTETWDNQERRQEEQVLITDGY